MPVTIENRILKLFNDQPDRVLHAMDIARILNEPFEDTWKALAERAEARKLQNLGSGANACYSLPEGNEDSTRENGFYGIAASFENGYLFQ